MGLGRQTYSSQTANQIDQEIKKLIDKLYEQTVKLMEDNKKCLESIAEALLKYETLTGDDVHAAVRGETLERPTILGHPRFGTFQARFGHRQSQASRLGIGRGIGPRWWEFARAWLGVGLFFQSIPDQIVAERQRRHSREGGNPGARSQSRQYRRPCCEALTSNTLRLD
ncbi:MAG: hypothetical protein R3E58_10415 [Phycisphaerae bacterium]